MPRRTLSQGSFFDPEFVRPACLRPGTVPWLLARHRHVLFASWLTEGWRGEGRLGRDSWPAVVLLTLLLLRWFGEGMSRLESLRRAANDLEWRAAMGLACDVEPPSERTVRDFEAFMRERHPRLGQSRFLLLHEHIVRLALQEGIGGKDPLWATDSTPMWCYGDVLDTVRLLGDGLRQLGGRWAKATRTPLAQVAEQWNMPLLLAKSTKGYFKVDWRQADARTAVVSELADKAIEIVEWVRAHLREARGNLRKGLLHRCASLMRVVRDDLETDEQGRLVIAEKVARDRLISLTDPQARHGRKSARSLFNGFKLHLLGDLVGGLILSATVTAGSEHDGTPAHRLIRRAKALVATIEQVLGDTAYAGSQMRSEIRAEIGVKLLTPPIADSSGRVSKRTRTGGKGGTAPVSGAPARGSRKTRAEAERATPAAPEASVRESENSQAGVESPTQPAPVASTRPSTKPRSSFLVDFAAGTVTCPNGIETGDYNEVQHPEYGAPTRRYKWSKEACACCPIRDGCHPGVRTGHSLLLHPFEQELREHRKEWEDPKIRELYRRRGEFERLNNEAVRHGARRARSWGLSAANFQAHTIVTVCNLRLLAVAMAQDKEKVMQVDQLAA